MDPVPIDYESAKRVDSSGQIRSNLIPLLKIGAMAIIIAFILAVALATPIRSNSQRAQTRVTLKALAAILGSYRTTTSSIPPNISALIFAATTTPSLSRAIAAFPPGIITTGPGGLYIIVDGSGNPIVLVNTLGNPRSPYFQSAGPDGILGTTDDMFSYDP